MPRPAGVNRMWVLDYTEDYRITSSKVSAFLRETFGDHDFHVKVIAFEGSLCCLL